MKTVYLSSLCVNFRDYERLKSFVDACPAGSVGVELATSWKYEEFDELLEAQRERFRNVPVTLHAPFVEICSATGSDERVCMEESFAKAFRWYRLFSASAMVMHTHEKKVLPGQHDSMVADAHCAICDMAETARSRGAHLTVENVGYPAEGNALFTQSEFVDFVQSLPEDVGALIDTGHAMANHWDIPELVKTLGTRIKGYHLHNTDGKHDLHRPIYELGMWYDAAAMDDLLRTIAQYSPAADLILEYAPGEHITAELLATDVEKIQRIWRL